jgi:hypothetical protein
VRHPGISRAKPDTYPRRKRGGPSADPSLAHRVSMPDGPREGARRSTVECRPTLTRRASPRVAHSPFLPRRGATTLGHAKVSVALPGRDPSRSGIPGDHAPRYSRSPLRGFAAMQRHALRARSDSSANPTDHPASRTPPLSRTGRKPGSSAARQNEPESLCKGPDASTDQREPGAGQNNPASPQEVHKQQQPRTAPREPKWLHIASSRLSFTTSIGGPARNAARSQEIDNQ